MPRPRIAVWPMASNVCRSKRTPFMQSLRPDTLVTEGPVARRTILQMFTAVGPEAREDEGPGSTEAHPYALFSFTCTAANLCFRCRWWCAGMKNQRAFTDGIKYLTVDFLCRRLTPRQNASKNSDTHTQITGREEAQGSSLVLGKYDPHKVLQFLEDSVPLFERGKGLLETATKILVLGRDTLNSQYKKERAKKYNYSWESITKEKKRRSARSRNRSGLCAITSHGHVIGNFDKLIYCLLSSSDDLRISFELINIYEISVPRSATQTRAENRMCDLNTGPANYLKGMDLGQRWLETSVVRCSRARRMAGSDVIIESTLTLPSTLTQRGYAFSIIVEFDKPDTAGIALYRVIGYRGGSYMPYTICEIADASPAGLRTLCYQTNPSSYYYACNGNFDLEAGIDTVQDIESSSENKGSFIADGEEYSDDAADSGVVNLSTVPLTRKSGMEQLAGESKGARNLRENT
ncbi:hypothetical protein EDD85DRAFT_939352 [Armillaria nabsnona]|nr:hypothetical protein EDD85DRAFT_939352 [Armillaria nabsnona]